MKKFLLNFFLVFLPTIAFGQTWQGQQFAYKPYTFATLPTVTTGTTLYCSDCQATNPASAGGVGAFCVSTASSTWNCVNAISNITSGSISSYNGPVSITGTQTNGSDQISSININGVINVKTYGAKGNGTTNDTASIQAALNAGTNIYVPIGTYIISTNSLVPQSNTKITCAGRYLTTFKAAAGETTLNLFKVWNLNNVTFEDCGFQPGGYTWGTDPNHTLNVGNAIDVQDSTNITIRHNYFTACHDCVSSRGSSAAGSVNQNLVVTDNEAVFSTPAFSFVNIIGQDGAIISRNTVWETIAHGTTNTLEANNGLYFYYTPDGTNAQSICRGISITDNKFYGFDSDNLETINVFCPNTIIKGNTVIAYANDNGAGTGPSYHDNIAVQSSGPTGLVYPGFSDVIVDGNYSEKGDGIRLNAIVGNNQNIIVADNIVKNAGCQAITVDGAASQVVNNLKIIGNTIDTVADFDVTATCGIGIFVTGGQTNTNFDISHNTLLNTQKDSIWLRTTVSDVILQGNIITNPGVRSGYGNGINGNSSATANSNMVMLGNVVNNVLSGTIGLEGGISTGVLFEGNFVNTIGVGADGFHVSVSGAAHFADNTCAANSGTCIANLGTGVSTQQDANVITGIGTSPTIRGFNINVTSGLTLSSSGGVLPTATCSGGSTGVAITPGSTNNRGQITTSSTASTNCTITWSTSGVWSQVPFCLFTDGNASITPTVFSTGACGTGTCVFDFASAASKIVNWVCM